VTGIDDPYEAPIAAEVVCRTDLETVGESAAKVLERVEMWMEQRAAIAEPVL
jgi:adenylylsulfate kinase